MGVERQFKRYIQTLVHWRTGATTTHFPEWGFYPLWYHELAKPRLVCQLRLFRLGLCERKLGLKWTDTLLKVCFKIIISHTFKLRIDYTTLHSGLLVSLGTNFCGIQVLALKLCNQLWVEHVCGLKVWHAKIITITPSCKNTRWCTNSVRSFICLHDYVLEVRAHHVKNTMIMKIV